VGPATNRNLEVPERRGWLGRRGPWTSQQRVQAAVDAARIAAAHRLHIGQGTLAKNKRDAAADRRDLRQDRRDLRQDRRDLRQDRK
jgi:hypothetical protein